MRQVILEPGLFVDVAVRSSTERVKGLLDFSFWAKNTDIEQVVHRAIAAWNQVLEGKRTGHSVGFLGVKSLPHPVQLVDHAVVEVEGWVVQRGEDVRSVAAHGVVARAVLTERASFLKLVLHKLNSVRVVASEKVV